MSLRDDLEAKERELGEQVDAIVIKTKDPNGAKLDRTEGLRLLDDGPTHPHDDGPLFYAWSKSWVFFVTDNGHGDSAIDMIPRHPTTAQPQFHGSFDF